MSHPFDSTAVRSWCRLALSALAQGREEIDAINVFPVADGDTGTNLYLTVEAASRALDEDGGADGADGADAASALATMSRGALLGACGNSGTILGQLLRGMAEVYGRRGADAADRLLCRALRHAADSAYEAVAHPVEGTMLTVARAAAEAAERGGGDGGGDDAGTAARAAHEGARRALAATTGQLEVLTRAGVVDAGASGLVAVLGALATALTDDPAAAPPHAPSVSPASPAAPVPPASPAPPSPSADTGPAFEVMYLLEAGDTAVRDLREVLDGLGDSLVVVGGDGLWNVHVHTDDAGAAVEAAVEAGRPYRIRVTGLEPVAAGTAPSCDADSRAAEPSQADASAAEPRARAVVALVHGDGLALLCEEAGATTLRLPAAGAAGVSTGGDGTHDDLEDALDRAIRRAHAHEVVLLPNDPELQGPAARAAERARAHGVRTAVIPTRSAVQGLAALAVHEPGHRFDQDVVAMTSAAGATRYGEVTVAEHRSWTTAGICQAGDVLGLVEGDVAVIGTEIRGVAADVLERMLAAGGELVTLVLGARAPAGLAERLEEQVRSGHLAVDTVVYEGRQQSEPLLIGVE